MLFILHIFVITYMNAYTYKCNILNGLLADGIVYNWCDSTLEKMSASSYVNLY